MNLVNPWVTNLVGLYQNSIVGNADNRGLDSDFARKTYIPTKLDTVLLPRIVEGYFVGVFLTGNPGDGKTAFLEKVLTALSESGATLEWKNSSGWGLRYLDKHFEACYDASESYKGISSDERLKKILAPLQGGTPAGGKFVRLVAINDGKLHSFFHQNYSAFRWLAPLVLDQAFMAPTESRDSVAVVNLKERTLVGLGQLATNGGPSIFGQMLSRFTERKEWSVCDGCSAESVCTIHANAETIGWSPGSSIVKEKLELLFAISRLRGKRHDTLRDLRSAIAFIITGNRNCQSIHDGNAANGRYYDQIFEAEDDALKEIGELDPSKPLRPKMDKLLDIMLQQKDHDFWKKPAFKTDPTLPRWTGKEPATHWITSFRRRLFFEGDEQFIRESLEGLSSRDELLPYGFLNLFIDFLTGTKKGSVDVLQDICSGISRQEGIRNNDLAGKDLLIRVTHSVKEGLTICRRFPLTEFVASVHHKHQSVVEWFPIDITLIHSPTRGRVSLSLDTFEIILRMSRGMLPGAQEHRALLEELSDFKGRLHRAKSGELVLIESNGQVHVVTQRDGKIIREQNTVSE